MIYNEDRRTRFGAWWQEMLFQRRCYDRLARAKSVEHRERLAARMQKSKARLVAAVLINS